MKMYLVIEDYYDYWAEGESHTVVHHITLDENEAKKQCDALSGEMWKKQEIGQNCSVKFYVIERTLFKVVPAGYKRSERNHKVVYSAPGFRYDLIGV